MAHQPEFFHMHRIERFRKAFSGGRDFFRATLRRDETKQKRCDSRDFGFHERMNHRRFLLHKIKKNRTSRCKLKAFPPAGNSDFLLLRRKKAPPVFPAAA
jgi:hypothetical protein